ncbi:hypothetical protein PI124_g20942 [Phytophthora idaei]|nr:hypothetical protein PI125_g26127 [Phytophthora idaei]KAG3234007.1 hypothetical protein PI124_g20942 [Phytophthora idaei]
MAETQKSLSSLGTPLETPGSQSQQFGKWADQYLRLMETAMNGRYELLPTSSSKSSTKDEVTGNINARLRAVLRVEEASFQEVITETKDHGTGVGRKKTQEEVAVGDAVQGEIDGVWRSECVKETNGTDICCEEFDQWKSKQHWRFDEQAVLKQFIRENRVGATDGKALERLSKSDEKVSDFVSKEVHASSRVVQDLVITAADVLDRVVEAASQEMKMLLNAQGRPYTQDERLFEDLDQQRLQALQEQMKAAVPVDSDGKVLLTEVMKAVELVTLSTEDREALEMQFVVEMINELNGLMDEKLSRLMKDSEHKIAERQQLKEGLACLANAKKEIELVC